MYSEPTISPTFVVRQKRKISRHPLILVGMIGMILLGSAGLLTLFNFVQATLLTTPSPTPHIRLKSLLITQSTQAVTITQEAKPTRTPVFVASVPTLAPNRTSSAQTVERKPVCQIESSNDVNVNIRSGPDLTFSIVGNLMYSDVVDAIAVSDNRWYQILHDDGTIGWVGGSVVDEIGDCDELTVVRTPVCALNNTSGNQVNIRDRATTSSNVIRTLAVNDLLMADGRTGDGWYRVFLSGEMGWIYQDVVTLSDACASLMVISASEPTPQPAIQDSRIAFSNDACVVESFTGDSVDLRKGPGMDYPIVAKMNKAMVASRVSSDGWYQIEDFGWAFAGDLKFSGFCHDVKRLEQER